MADIRSTLVAGKSTSKNHPVIAALDIGTTKVSLAIGTVNENQGIDIVGLGTCPSQGVRQGVVVNVEVTIDAIKKAREEAELMAGYSIDQVWVGIGGSHVRSFDSRGMVAIRNKEVQSDDIQRVIEAAKAVAVPSDREVLHVLPREYKIDEQDGISDPHGMSGVRLEANVHIVTAGKSAIHNIVRCAEKAGLKVRGLVLQQMASSLAVLSEDERKLGVCVVDMGGGSCEMVTYINGSVAHTAVVPVGGQNFTHDIAMGLRTPQASAEKVKRKNGSAIADLVDENETIEVEGVGGRKPRSLLRKTLCEVIEPRAEETMALIYRELDNVGVIQRLGSGIVLTGGAAQLDGLVELAEFIIELPVRRGIPDKVGGLTDVIRAPENATAVGLITYGYNQDKPNLLGEAEGPLLANFAGKIREFFIGN